MRKNFIEFLFEFLKSFLVKNVYRNKSFSEIYDEKFVILIVGDQDVTTLKNLVETTMEATHSKTLVKANNKLIPSQGNKRDPSLSRHKKRNFIQIILLQFSAIKAYPLLYVEKNYCYLHFIYFSNSLSKSTIFYFKYFPEI
jgi:hypothetical protein